MEKRIGEKQKDKMLSSSGLIGSQAMSHPQCIKVMSFEPRPLLGQVYVYTQA